MNFPSNSSRKALWNPHPKHSNPKSVLLKQGIMYCSKSNGFIFYNFTKKYETVEIINHCYFKVYYFWNLNTKDMKKFIIPIMIVAILVALYEQVNAEKNVYMMAIAIAVFMFGMMRLSAKTPSKNQNKEEDHVQ